MTEGESISISRRIVGFVPEAEDALHQAAEELGITENEAANNAVIIYFDLIKAGLTAGKTLLIIDDKTRAIEGGIIINPTSFEESGSDETSRVIPFRPR